MVHFTYAKARHLLAPGDTVYSIYDGKITEHEVVKIHADSLVVNDGCLYFDDIRDSWWLTKRGAMDALSTTWRY